ncbi:hypothetical protein BN3590_02183 [Clostridium sp. C105KSO15]|nr:hypothetical protein BN3590_02183 [Clostridium sp. C105KSO15]
MNKEKFSKTLNDFLTRNEEYAIEIYLKNTDIDSFIGRFLAPSGRNYDQNGERGFKVSWNSGVDSLCIPHNEVINCYDERDEYGIQTIYVIMESGVSIEFECCGMRV